MSFHFPGFRSIGLMGVPASGDERRQFHTYASRESRAAVEAAGFFDALLTPRIVGTGDLLDVVYDVDGEVGRTGYVIRIVNGHVALTPAGGASPLLTTATAAANAAALTAYLLANVGANGKAVALLEPGTYDLEWAPDVAALYAAGVRKLVLAERVPGSVTLRHSNLAPAIKWDNSDRASAPLSVSALSLQLHNTYDYIHRLSIAGSGWSKNDIINIQSQDRPVFSATSRYVGENFRARTVDADYVWVDGHLEFSEYATSIVARRLDTGIKLRVQGPRFEATGDSSDTGVTARAQAHSIRLTAAVDCHIVDCEFDRPWWVSVRLECCADCDTTNCRFSNGLNQSTVSQLTYGVQCYGACFNCWMVGCASTGYRHTWTSDGAAATSYDPDDWAQYGQPTWCGARDSHASESKGAAWDTHEEGAMIFFINCEADNQHSSDTVPASFVGTAFQIRARRVTIKDCTGSKLNNGINIKPQEHGPNNWVRIINTDLFGNTQQTDQGRGIFVDAASGNPTITNPVQVIVEGGSVRQLGVGVELDVPCKFESHAWLLAQLHRGYFKVDAAGCEVINMDMQWDSRSSNLPGAATANRTLYGCQLVGAQVFHNLGLKHILGSDAADGDPPIFDAIDATGTKTISLTGYVEADPSGIGPCLPIAAGDNASFTWDRLDETVRLAVAALPSAPMKAGRRVFVTDAATGAQPAWDNGTNWKRFSDGATVT